MVILVSEASNRYTHLFLVERQYFDFNTLESVILDNYELSSISEYPVWRYSCANQLKLEKRGCSKIPPWY